MHTPQTGLSWRPLVQSTWFRVRGASDLMRSTRYCDKVPASHSETSHQESDSAFQALGSKYSARIYRIGGFCRRFIRGRFKQSFLESMAQLCRQCNLGITREGGRWLPIRVVVVRWFEHHDAHAYRVPAGNPMFYQGDRNQTRLSPSEGVNIRDDIGLLSNTTGPRRSRTLLPQRELHSTRLEVLSAGLRTRQTRV